ncbi:IS21 family transposase, partial [mine drainage metagenome]
PSVPKAKILDLARGDFVRDHENLVYIGPSGLGKTHLGIGICRQIIQQGYRARFVTVSALMNELLSAQSRFELPKCLRQWTRFDLIMVDEIGYVPLSPDGPGCCSSSSQRCTSAVRSCSRPIWSSPAGLTSSAIL